MNKNEELISIVMPTYNGEKYIIESIKSVLCQTYQNWELLVIDDGSRDNTFQMIIEVSNTDQRIRTFKNKSNLGVSATRNKGIELARGDWIAFLDSDDIWEKNKLEKQLDYANKNSAEFLFTGSSFINEKGEMYKGKLEVPEKVTYKKLRNHNIISCSSVLIKKKFFIDIKMERDQIHEDYATWLKILRLGVTAYGINEPLLIYRISRNSKSGNKINTIKMTYEVFRFIDLNPMASTYFMIRHIIASVGKYKKIFS